MISIKVKQTNLTYEDVDGIFKQARNNLDSAGAMRSVFELMGVIRAGLQSKESIEKRFVQVKKLIEESEELDENQKNLLLKLLRGVEEIFELQTTINNRINQNRTQLEDSLIEKLKENEGENE